MVIGVDYGRKRIGLAMLHGDGLVLPLATIEQVSRKVSLHRVAKYLADFDCRHVVVGLPVNMDMTTGASAQAAERFAEALRTLTGATVELYDERLSSFEARDRMRELPTSIRRGGKDDALAACVILESWWQQHSR